MCNHVFNNFVIAREIDVFSDRDFRRVFVIFPTPFNRTLHCVRLVHRTCLHTHNSKVDALRSS